MSKSVDGDTLGFMVVLNGEEDKNLGTCYAS